MRGLGHETRHEVSDDRERAVRLVFERRQEYPSEWAAICSIVEKCDMGPETLRKWVRRAAIDEGQRPGVTTSEAQRIKELERENKDLYARTPVPGQLARAPGSGEDVLE